MPAKVSALKVLDRINKIPLVILSLKSEYGTSKSNHFVSEFIELLV